MTETYHIQEFSTWLAGRANNIEINLNISRSRKVTYRIQATVVGINAIRDVYAWKASWQNSISNTTYTSENWVSTSESLGALKSYVQKLVFGSDSSEELALTACLQVLNWGGDRNSANGATPFLRRLSQENRLRAYLGEMKSILSLSNTSSVGNFEEVECMNSMMTKIHAFCSTDGLPIYDSRVAAAAACLVEMYRREKLENGALPQYLQFPSVGGGGARRAMATTFPDGQTTSPIWYGSTTANARWSKAKVTLGRILKATLDKNSSLFPNERNLEDRMRAFEACLFMMGYNVECFGCKSVPKGDPSGK